MGYSVTKYLATTVGYCVVSRPFFNLDYEPFKTKKHSELMEDYYRSGRMLLNLAMAVGRLVLAGREVTRLAGYTARVTKLIDVLNDLSKGKYVRTMVENPNRELKPNSGKIITKDNIIKFENVPIITPNGDILVDNLNIEVLSGMNVLVSGPNGCGKSSLFRILGGLWPLFGGILTKPSSEKLFYIPQRPYLSIGTLRDQIIYPHTLEQFRKSGKTDKDLLLHLKSVSLENIVERNKEGLDFVDDWTDVLSGGEKQRVAMARLFYHKPQFAILDECTSQVSVDVEGFMYNHCKDLEITLFTVSHRKTLWKYHEFVLKFDGVGHYDFDKMKLEDQ